ncbi:unnamed protein product [Pseudo-nitzschia multistriata]|uniref:Uncharacterized protein n=1 Tax=Pseudo-nitzschia multistriata TaxID=183589 RepID=A0A448ZF34_9STRA|nr:unnamed protein product [Pseudo-nitzschia multistriata]
MGNAAGKAIDEAVLVEGTLNKDEGRFISKPFVSNEGGITKIKNKGKTWVTTDGESLLWTSKSSGVFKCHSVITDAGGSQVAIIVTEKKAMTSSTNWILKTEPSFDGQDPVSEEDLQKAGIAKKDEPSGILLYKFSKIEVNRKLTTGVCTYGIVKGQEDFLPLYVGERLSSMGFKALFKEVSSTNEDGILVAKAYMPGMSMSPHVEVAAGVDMLAIVSIGYALAGDDSSAGALAGAGVV